MNSYGNTLHYQINFKNNILLMGLIMFLSRFFDVIVEPLTFMAKQRHMFFTSEYWSTALFDKSVFSWHRSNLKVNKSVYNNISNKIKCYTNPESNRIEYSIRSTITSLQIIQFEV